jgi:parallel beta-helix repeat protein
MKNIFRKTLVLIIIALFISMSVVPSNAIKLVVEKPSIMSSINNTLYVGGNGPGNYTSIQDAIDNASDGDTIFVYNGVYSRIIVNKKLTIIGEDKENSKIYAYKNKIKADGVTLSGFTLYKSDGYADPILLIKADNITISDCILYPEQKITQFYGIKIRYSNNVSIFNCEIKNFLFANIFIMCFSGPVKPCTNCLIENCTITGSRRGVDIALSHGGGHSIVNCSIFNCGWGGMGLAGGIVLDGAKPINLENCSIYNNKKGVESYGVSYNKIIGCKFYENDIGVHILDPNYGGDHGKKSRLISNIFAYNKIGVLLDKNCFNNSIYYNDFLYNTVSNAVDYGGINIWDNDYPSGGNYWSDYTGEDNNGDDIGDTPYYIPGSANKDRYPLMILDEPFQPPKPDIPTGPIIGKKYVIYNYSTSVIDPNNDTIFYNFSWGDGTCTGWLGPYKSGETVEASHIWTCSNKYTVKVIAKDEGGLISSWSDPITVNISIPSIPILTGPKRGRPGEIYEFTIISSDPDGDNLNYLVRWRYPKQEEWFVSCKSGQIISINRSFDKLKWYQLEAWYHLEVWVWDVDEAYGGWNQTDICIVRARTLYSSLFMRFLEQFPILRHLLRL